MTGFMLYTLGIAAIATVAFQVMLMFVVPQFVAMAAPAGGIPRFSHLVFEAGAGTALLALLWALSGWTLWSLHAARRAILLRAWPTWSLRFNLLRGAILRHRVLLQAWTASALIDERIDVDAALRHAQAILVAWCGRSAPASGTDDAALAAAARLGTLREELEHRIAAELVDAPLALAARRERQSLLAGLVSAVVVVPLLVAMYLMLFNTAQLV
jgi:type II secretory pathway component PulF